MSPRSLLFLLSIIVPMPGIGADTPAPRSIDPLLHTQAERRTAIEARVVPWLAANAHGFETDALSPATLAPLVVTFGDARVIGIGEITHGTHEDTAFKAALIEALITEREIGIVAFELNRSTGDRLNLFVSPLSAAVDPAIAMRHAGVYSVWQTQELADLLVWIKRWNQTATTPVRIIGVDVQASAHDFDDALLMLARVDPAGAAALRTRLALVLAGDARNEHIGSTVATMTHAQWLDAIAAAGALDEAIAASSLPKGTIGVARFAVSGAVEGLRMFEYSAKDLAGVTPPADYYSRRDVAMANRLLAGVPKDARAAFWAHDMHVMRQDVSTGFGGATVGTRLNEKLGPDGYRVVNFTYSRAELHAIDIQPGKPRNASAQPAPVRWSVSAKPGALGELTARIAPPNYWVDLATLPDEPWAWGWRLLPYDRLSFGWGFSEDALSTPYEAPDGIRSGFDILVHVGQMTASHRLPASK